MVSHLKPSTPLEGSPWSASLVIVLLSCSIHPSLIPPVWGLAWIKPSVLVQQLKIIWVTQLVDHLSKKESAQVES